MAAIAGFVLLALSYFFIRLFELGDPRLSPVFKWWKSFAPPTPYLGTCLTSLAIAWPLAKLLNLHTDKSLARQEEVQENGDEFEQMLVDAIAQAYERPQLYMVTLSTGKVYIGVVLSENDMYGRRKYLTLLKFASGYRDDKKRVQITTSYAQVLKDIGHRNSGTEASSPLPKDVTEADFQVVLPKEEVFSISRYEPEVASYFPDGPDTTTS
jgi:hypothetical protein